MRQKRLVRQWLHSFVRNAGKTGADVNYVLCGDEYLYRLNLQFLNHDTYTDILTFPDFGEDMTGSQTLRGECYISTERVRDHAVQMGISHADELHRVMVHGILHLQVSSAKSKCIGILKVFHVLIILTFTNAFAQY